MTKICKVGIALLMAAVWGYFADLSVGEVGWSSAAYCFVQPWQ